MIELWDLSIALVGLFLSASMLTCLYGKGNPLYAFAEQLYIGAGVGMAIVMNLIFIYRTGIGGIQAGDYTLIIGLVAGVMVWARLIPKYAYISRLSLAMTIGTSLGISLRTLIFSRFIDQLKASFIPLITNDLYTSFVNIFIVISLFTQMTFFLYTMELKGPLRWTSKIGEYIMFAAFGGVFAQTFMGRLGLFVGFAQNATIPPWKAPIFIGSLILCFAIVIILDRKKLLEKLTPTF